ncbi:class I SAM-dependent methyltransferase [Thermodesulfobacteriota bacterium]
MIGEEIAFDPNLGAFEKFYIRLFGVPICGLRIRLRRLLPKFTGTPEKILDAGCGRGIFTYQMAKRYPAAQVLGVDIDADQLAVNRTIAHAAQLDNITFEKVDVARLPFREGFDLVLSVDNLEHIENDNQALAGIAKALKPGGCLILHVPGAERRWFLFSFHTNFDVPGHFRPGYTLDEIRNKVQKTGLTINESHYTYGWIETVANNISYAITRAEAKNRILYALLFPLLNSLAWLGRNSRPKKGAGILIIATKKRT